MLIKLFRASAAFHEIGGAVEGPNIVKASQNAQHNKSYSTKIHCFLLFFRDVNNMLNLSQTPPGLCCQLPRLL